MSTYWGNHAAVFITFTKRYIRILVGNRKHQYTHAIQRLIQEGWVDKGEIVQEEEFLRALSSLVKQYKLAGSKTYVSFSSHDLLLRTTKLPLSVPIEELRGSLYMALGESFQLPFQDPIIEIVGAEEVEGEREVRALAVPEDGVNKMVSILKKAKLRPVVMDVPFLNLYRLFQEQFQLTEQQNVLLIHAELDVVQLSMFFQHTPIYVRTFNLAVPTQYSAFEARTGFQYIEVPDDDVVLTEHMSMMQKEIERLQSFYQFNLQQGKQKIDTICISGDHPLLSELEKIYRDLSDITVYHLEKQQWGTKSRYKVPDSFAELVGLSWK
ncbi:MAG: type IV pilus biogenesis protein PilM [Paenisporosarcina sp.]